MDAVDKTCCVERTKENILFLSYNTCSKNIFIAKVRVMNFVRARIILTFRIEYWKNKVKYHKLKLIEFSYQVQLDVLHKPEIEPEQVFIHTKDGEEVEVSAFYPLI